MGKLSFSPMYISSADELTSIVYAKNKKNKSYIC